MFFTVTIDSGRSYSRFNHLVIMSCKISGTGPEASAFAKALGLNPKDTFKIELIVEADSIVTVICHKHVSNEELESLTTILKKYDLVKKEKEEEEILYRCVKCGWGFSEKVNACFYCGSTENIIKISDMTL